MAQQIQRGIHIPLSRKSWNLVIQTLRMVAKDEGKALLDGKRYECGRIANYIKMHLDAQE